LGPTPAGVYSYPQYSLSYTNIIFIDFFFMSFFPLLNTEQGGDLDPRTAIKGSFSAWGSLGKPDRGLGRGETFFPDSSSDRDSDETFQISRNLGLEHVEFFCLLDSQPCLKQNSTQDFNKT
jgi:hypothetical protein